MGDYLKKKDIFITLHPLYDACDINLKEIIVKVIHFNSDNPFQSNIA